MVWIGFNIATSKITVPAASAILAASYNAAALLLRPFTIVRTRLDWWSLSDQVAAAEEPQLALGLMTVSDEAIAVGVTAVPDPITNTDAAWFVYETAIPAVQISTAVGFESPAGTQRIVDSKARY